MSAANVLLKPEECAMLLVDFQAGLGFGVESIPRQLVVNNAVGLARTAVAFKVSGHRVDIRIPSLQRSLASGVAGGSSGRKTYRAQKHERLGG
jgi:hypothetical protein